MVGYRVERKPDGIRVWKNGEEIFLNHDECNKLAALVWEARRKYWK